MPEAPPGTREIDESLAWDLVLAARETEFAPNAGKHVIRQNDGLPGGDRIAIDVFPKGGWRTSHRVSREAVRVLDIYLPYAASGKSRTVLAQMGQSLDGYIATQTGHSHYVTGERSLDHLHRLRALSDVVLVGANTAVADNPQLTVRRVPGSNPTRAVIDPHGRVPDDRAIYQDRAAPTLVLTTRETGAGRTWPRSVEPVTVPHENGELSPGAIVETLSGRGLDRVLVEGGGITISRFLRAGMLDRLHICVASLIIGSGLPALSLPPVAHLNDALRPPCRRHPMGEDILFDLDLG